jgi:AcrR family transcriptional regulator
LARVDLRRRAEIGRERRAKSRAKIIEAARLLFASRPIACVTIEEVTTQARVARGSFYSHFRTLDELRAALAADLAAVVRKFRRLDRAPHCRPGGAYRSRLRCLHRRSSTRSRLGRADRSRRIRFSGGRECGARAPESEPPACPMRRTFGSFSNEVGFDLVFGVVIQTMRSASEARLSPADVPDVLRGILRALGIGPEEANRALRLACEAPNALRRAAPARARNLV